MSSATPPRMGRVMSLQGGFDDEGPHESPDSFDALRDLFLGGAEEVAGRPSSPAPRQSPDDSIQKDAAASPEYPLVEALVLGHLPVQQSPWVMQYARDAAAQRGGPVALLRIREGEATLDVVGGTAATEHSAKSSIDEAFASIASKIKGVIVRVDATTEPLLPELACIDALTLLTGADEAAVVGSYRTIKSLLAAVDDQTARLRLAIMGSTPEKALLAAEKIQKAVAAHLKQDIAVSACLARIASGRSSLIFRGLITDDIGEVLDRVREVLVGGGSRVMPVSIPTPKAPPQAPTIEHAEPAGPSAVVSRLGHASPALPSAPVAKVSTPSLASHIPGLSPTRIASPFHTGVEFALDQTGGINLLIHAATAADVGPAIGTLLAAGAWAKAHAALIGLALNSRTTEASAGPTLHLMTGSAKGCRGVSEAGIRLHLLSKVEVEGRSGWFCAEIG